MPQTNYEFFVLILSSTTNTYLSEQKILIIKTFYAEKKVLNWIQLIWEKVLQHWKLSLLTNWIYFLASGRTNVCIKVKYPSATIKWILYLFVFWADMPVRAGHWKFLHNVWFKVFLFLGQNRLKLTKWVLFARKYFYSTWDLQLWCAYQNDDLQLVNFP